MNSTASQAIGATQFSLEQLMQIAAQENPIMNVLKAQEDSARASIKTAESFLNPEIEAGSGPTKDRNTSQDKKDNWGVTISQSLEFPNVRNARRAIAESKLQYVESNSFSTKVNLNLQIKKRFYDVIQNQEILKIAESDRDSLRDIRGRVALKVDVGDSPRYELIKADTELIAAERDAQAAKLKIYESKLYLKGLIGKSIPDDFDVIGVMPNTDIKLDIVQIRNEIKNSPKLKQIKAASEVAENRLRLEEKLINPGVTLKAGVNQDPDLTQYRFGLSIPLPLWNQRQGQIGEATANFQEVQAQLSDQELTLTRDVESAYQRYLIAQQQVSSFETGLLTQAESVLKVVEAAYRYGERGILEYLDAQRTFRLVKKDYLTARHDYIIAILEIEQLLNIEIMRNQI
ncbi:RND transporter [Methylophilaceae bacterium]|nr:RND transporter [Methylophilaceae bacterium]